MNTFDNTIANDSAPNSLPKYLLQNSASARSRSAVCLRLGPEGSGFR